METIKDILTENRESVISSIKYVFKVWKNEDVKTKMIEFLRYATDNSNLESLLASKKMKSDLKVLVQKMAINQRKSLEGTKNLELYGTTNPKMSEIRGRFENNQNEKGLFWNPILKDWVKA